MQLVHAWSLPAVVAAVLASCGRVAQSSSRPADDRRARSTGRPSRGRRRAGVRTTTRPPSRCRRADGDAHQSRCAFLQLHSPSARGDPGGAGRPPARSRPVDGSAHRSRHCDSTTSACSAPCWRCATAIDDQPGARGAQSAADGAVPARQDTSGTERPLLAPEPSGSLADLLRDAAGQRRTWPPPGPVEPLLAPAADEPDPEPAGASRSRRCPSLSDDRHRRSTLHRVLPIPAPPHRWSCRRRGRRGLRRSRVS